MSTAVKTAPQLEAPILDVFGSLQGEGVCVGDPQIFVRFGGCNLVCDYCDTPESIPAGSGTRRSVSDVLHLIDELRASRFYRAVSLTGGEPLLHVRFLAELIPDIRRRGLGVYLETNGSLPQALEKVVKGCDWVSMDFKPVSAVGRDLWEAHRWFLRTCGSKAFVKLVLTESTTSDDLKRTVKLIADVRPETPLILQPATQVGPARSLPAAQLASWWAWAGSRLPDVRVIPQVHRLWDIP
jgi:organic radical activating enzyme